MAEPVRLYVDQHLPWPVSQGFRRHGIDVLTTLEAARCSMPDADQLTFSTADQRVMVTFDPDFLVLHQAGNQHGGIVWCPEQKYGVGQHIQALLLVHGILDRANMRNHVEYL